MAITTYENPRFFKGPVLQLCTMRAKDGLTWQPGQFARNTATGVVLTTPTTAKAQYLTAQSQATATSSSDVLLYRIPSADTKFYIGANSAGNSVLANKKYIGTQLGIAVNACIVTASIANTSHVMLHVEDVMADIGVGRSLNTTSTVPGTFIVSVIQSAIDAG